MLGEMLNLLLMAWWCQPAAVEARLVRKGSREAGRRKVEKVTVRAEYEALGAVVAAAVVWLVLAA